MNQKKYICRYSENNQSVELMFDGQINFNYMNNNIKIQDNYFVFEQYNSSFSESEINGLLYLFNNLSVNGNNYQFIVCINNQELVLYEQNIITNKIFNTELRDGDLVFILQLN